MDITISIPDLLTLLTMSGVAVYVVGMVGLTITMRLEFTDDVSTAWYAVALLSRTTVAGQGVRIWLRWTVPYALFAIGLGALIVASLKAGNIAVTAALVPLIPASGLGLLILLYVSILNNIQKEVRPPQGAKSPKEAKQVGRLTTFFNRLPRPLNNVSHIVSWLFPCPPLKAKRVTSKRVSFGHFKLATIMSGIGSLAMSQGAFVVISAIGAENIVKIICGETDIRGKICSVDVSRAVGAIANDPSQGVFLGIMLFIAGGFFFGISAAATVDHPLPYAEIYRHPTSESRDGARTPLVGYLVTHADGFWYFFDEDHPRLLSIPDAQVAEVRLLHHL